MSTGGVYMHYPEFNDNHLVYNHRHMKQVSTYRIPPQVHDIYEMIYVKTGNLIYSVEEKSYQVRSNSLILTRPGKLHILQLEETGEYDRYDIFFEAEVTLKSVLEQIPAELDVVAFDEETPLLPLFQKMDHYCNHFEGQELKTVLCNLVEQIIYELVIFLQQDTSKQTGRHTANPTVAAAIEYIDNHLHMDLSLDTLCKELYISKSYLHQLFIRFLQISPKRYIAGKRLIAAQQAIRSGEHPTDIYTRFGFSDYSSFYRAYCKQFGYAPSEELDRRVGREIAF